MESCCNQTNQMEKEKLINEKLIILWKSEELRLLKIEGKKHRVESGIFWDRTGKAGEALGLRVYQDMGAQLSPLSEIIVKNNRKGDNIL